MYTTVMIIVCYAVWKVRAIGAQEYGIALCYLPTKHHDVTATHVYNAIVLKLE